MFLDPESGVELEVADKMPLVEWFANHYKDFGELRPGRLRK